MAITSKLNIGIIGSGKVGTDLLIKVLKSEYLHCGLFVGRNLQSEGMKKAMSLGVIVSDQSIDAFKLSRDSFDLVFDATTAEHHRKHAEYFRRASIKAIDLTPAKAGRYCVPTIDANDVMNEANVNMVTCGGQASIPVVHTLSKVYPHIHRVDVQSRLAADSVGPGTLANIDDYYSSTSSAISAYSCIQNVNVELQVEQSVWKPDMLTIIRAYTDDTDLDKLYGPLQQRLAEIRKQVPGYNIVGTPVYKDGAVEVVVSVRGQGDWIPAHAGNLDIINCAALAIAEQYARHVGVKTAYENAEPSGALGSLFGLFGKGTKGIPETA